MTYKQAKQRRPLYYSWDEVPVLMDCVMAGQLLGISPDGISKLCRSGELPATKLGGLWMIKKSTIMQIVGE